MTDAFRELVYWRRNPYWGGSCVPVVLEFDGSTVQVKDRQLTSLAAAAVNQITINITRFGTSTYAFPGRRFALIGMPAKTSPLPTEEQKAYVGAANPYEHAAFRNDVTELGAFVAASKELSQHAVVLQQHGATLTRKTSALKFLVMFVGFVVFYAVGTAQIFAPMVAVAQVWDSDTGLFVGGAVSFVLMMFILSRTGYFKR